jgi:hypothetical protein
VSVQPPTLDVIIASVCATLRVTPSEIDGRSKHHEVVLARSCVVKLARKHTHASYPEIARAMARTNHSTFVTADKRMDRLLESDPVIWEGHSLSTVIVLCEQAMSMRMYEIDRSQQTEFAKVMTHLEAKVHKRDRLRHTLEEMLRLPPGQMLSLNFVALEATYNLLNAHPEVLHSLMLCASSRNRGTNGTGADTGTHLRASPHPSGGGRDLGHEPQAGATRGTASPYQTAGAATCHPGRTRVA